MENTKISQEVTVFHGRNTPEKATLVGYGAIIDAMNLPLPMPEVLALISFKNRQYKNNQWQVFTFRHLPADNLYNHLVFAIKYEGINPLFFKKLFQQLTIAWYFRSIHIPCLILLTGKPHLTTI